MKFINYLSTISGVGVFPLIAMILFVTVFSYVLWSTFRTSKESMHEQRNIPLD